MSIEIVPSSMLREMAKELNPFSTDDCRWVWSWVGAVYVPPKLLSSSESSEGVKMESLHSQHNPNRWTLLHVYYLIELRYRVIVR